MSWDGLCVVGGVSVSWGEDCVLGGELLCPEGVTLVSWVGAGPVSWGRGLCVLGGTLSPGVGGLCALRTASLRSCPAW